MDDEEKKEEKDLKEDEETTEDESASEETTPVEDPPLKKDEEEEKEEVKEDASKEVVDEMLADGTPSDKNFTIKKSKYDELNEKSALYEQFAPLLAKLKDKPELVDEIMENKKGETVEQRLVRLEDGIKDKERTELRSSLTEAVNTWPDFREKWEEIKPLFHSLEKSGISKREALQRAYFAVNPEAAAQEKRLVAQGVENAQGKTSSAGGASRRVVEDASGKYVLTDADKEVARAMGIPEELYQKHAGHISKFSDL